MLFYTLFYLKDYCGRNFQTVENILRVDITESRVGGGVRTFALQQYVIFHIVWVLSHTNENIHHTRSLSAHVQLLNTLMIAQMCLKINEYYKLSDVVYTSHVCKRLFVRHIEFSGIVMYGKWKVAEGIWRQNFVSFRKQRFQKSSMVGRMLN